MSGDSFAMVRRDELWLRGALTESRSSQGEALQRGNEIVARDVIDDQKLRDALRERCDLEMGRVHAAIPSMRDARIRGVVTASSQGLESTISITVDDLSIVTTVEHAAADYDALKRLAPHPHPRSPALPPPPRPLPMVWRNGSAAVLLHEAIGHASEHAHAPIAWPRWLRLRDVARDGRTADLLAGESPAALRRQSFRDVPLRRMTSLLIEQAGAPFEIPEKRIEVHLVAGGSYEPLDETIAITTAVADLVTRKGVQRLRPMRIRATRHAIARALRGATGDPIRYPGVICSREGQELYVASQAPVMVTAELA